MKNKNKLGNLRSDRFATSVCVYVRVVISWGIPTLLRGRHRLQPPCSGLKMEAKCFSDTLITTRESAWRHNPAEHRHLHCHENLSSDFNSYLHLLRIKTADLCHRSDHRKTLCLHKTYPWLEWDSSARSQRSNGPRPRGRRGGQHKLQGAFDWSCCSADVSVYSARACHSFVRRHTLHPNWKS